jgi:hypothetical protein
MPTSRESGDVYGLSRFGVLFVACWVLEIGVPEAVGRDYIVPILAKSALLQEPSQEILS